MFDVWKNVLAEVEQNIPREQYSTWFTGIELASADDGIITINVPNIFKVKQLEKKYFTTLKTAFEHNSIPVKEIKYQVQNSVKPRVRARETTASVITPITTTHNHVAQKDGGTKESFQTGLNPRYTLANFVIGSNNNLAVSVAQGIVDQPGSKYNPFFLYGKPGLGKTHLVQAIGNELLLRNPKLKILYSPMSNFYSEFIVAVRNNKGDEFHQKFKQLDVLIIDDFQMIIGKERSQAEFFDIFNELHGLNKQIIVTSDRLPSQIQSVDERLASRLTWAGAYDLQLPQFEDKCAILKAKAEFNGVEVEDAAIEYIAEHVKTNIRDLEGEFNHLLAVADLKNMTPLEVINEGYVNTARSPQTKTVSPKTVLEKVAKFYQLTPQELCSKSRVAHIKNARQVAMYLLSKELSISTIKIASEVGVKDHTTVMHGIKKVDSNLKLDFTLRDQLAAIREAIYA